MVHDKKFRFYALKLTGIIIIIFVLQILISGFTDLFLLDSSAYFQPWRFITAIFLHGGFGHLLSNMFALALFGSILESLIGGKRFLLVFLITGILANLISVNIYESSLGASGAIYGILGALIVLRPFMLVWAAGVPVPMIVAGVFWVLADVSGVFDPSSNIANFAHLSGMLFGLLIGFFYRLRSRLPRRVDKFRIDEGLVRRWEKYYMKDDL